MTTDNEFQNEQIQLLLADIENVELSEINKLIGRLKTELEDRRVTAAAALLKRFEDDAASIGMTTEQILSANQAKGKSGRGATRSAATPSAPKYRNPDNHEQVWSGRGNSPEWFKAKMNAGVDKKELEIPAGEAGAA